MSYLIKACSSFLQNGLGATAGCAVHQAARQFHAMLKPLPRATIAACAPKTPTAGDALSLISFAGDIQRLLTPTLSMISQVAGFKVKGRLKRRCKDCYFVIRQQRHYVICPTHPRHKQMSMKKRDYKSWILTDATQSKVRPF